MIRYCVAWTNTRLYDNLYKFNVMIINVRTEVRVNTSVCFTLFPPEMVGWRFSVFVVRIWVYSATYTNSERPYFRTLKWINGNCIMHLPSLHVDSLLFKVLQLAGKTSSVTFGMWVISGQLCAKELNTGYLW